MVRFAVRPWTLAAGTRLRARAARPGSPGTMPCGTFTASFHSKLSGIVAGTEQRAVALGRQSPRTGVIEETRLDVATRDAASGRKIFIDTMVTCAQCGFGPRQQARAGRDGVAAADGGTPPRAGSWFRWSSRLGGAQLRRPWPSSARGPPSSTRLIVPGSSALLGSNTALCCSPAMRK